MNSSNSLRRFQGHVSRLLGLVPHSTSAAVGDAGLVTAAPLTSLPSAPYLFTRRTRTFTSAAAYRVDAPVKDHEEFKVITFDTSEEFDEPAELTLPSDIRDIQKLNPELAEAMEAHAEFAR